MSVGRDDYFRRIAIGLTVAAIGLHILSVSSLDGFWRDEVVSINLATLPLRESASLLPHDGYPPLYFLLL